MLINKYLWGSIVFLGGCFCYLVDAIKNDRRTLNIISAVLFNIGSILFILDAYNKIKFENRTVTHFKKIYTLLAQNRQSKSALNNKPAFVKK